MPFLTRFAPFEDTQVMSSLRTDAVLTSQTGAQEFSLILDAGAVADDVLKVSSITSIPGKVPECAAISVLDGPDDTVNLGQSMGGDDHDSEHLSDEGLWHQFIILPLNEARHSTGSITSDNSDQLADDGPESSAILDVQVDPNNQPPLTWSVGVAEAANFSGRTEEFSDARIQSVIEHIQLGQSKVSQKVHVDLVASSIDSNSPMKNRNPSVDIPKNGNSVTNQERYVPEATGAGAVQGKISHKMVGVSEPVPGESLSGSRPESFKFKQLHNPPDGVGFPATRAELSIERGGALGLVPLPKSPSGMEDMRIPIGRDPESGYPNAHHAADVRSIPLASAEPADISAKEASVGPAPGNLVPDLQSTAGLSEKPIAVLIPESNAASQGSKEETRSPQLENEKISAVKASSPPELRNSFEHQPIGYGRKSETLENPSVVAAEPAINDTKPLVPFFHTQSSGPTHHISAQVDSSLSTPELARSVAIQVAEKVAGSVGPEIDLALNPEELGRFRILLKPSETGISVTILADRPETLDLMRRHIDALSQEFRSIGYSTTSFSFGQGAKQDQKSSHPNEAMSRGPDSENNPTELPTGARLKMRPDGSLDLKL